MDIGPSHSKGTDTSPSRQSIGNLAGFLDRYPETSLGALANTLQKGRREFGCRAVLVSSSIRDLRDEASRHERKAIESGSPHRVMFMYPGQGAQYPGMGQDLYSGEPVFRGAFDHCANLIEMVIDEDIRSIVFPDSGHREEKAGILKNTNLAQPAIFSIEYALTQLWRHWGIEPASMIGHSIGEFAAACIAGVFSLEDAIRMICIRGQLMADLPGGRMISVRATEEEIQPYLSDEVCLAAVNGAKSCVIAGGHDAADLAEYALNRDGFETKGLHTSHAFHSSMMDEIVPSFEDHISECKLNAPEIPILSTVTVDWLRDEEATDPSYWANHLRRTVRFYDAISRVWELEDHLFLEVGPGRTLATLTGQNPNRKKARPALGSMPHPTKMESSHLCMRRTLGELWCHGLALDWDRIEERDHPGKKIPVPTYPFQRKRFFVEPLPLRMGVEVGVVNGEGANDIGAEEEAELIEDRLDTVDSLKQLIASLSGMDLDDLDETATFLELGFDSLFLTQVGKEIQTTCGVKVTLRQLIDEYPSIRELAGLVDEKSGGPRPATRRKAAGLEKALGSQPSVGTAVVTISGTDSSNKLILAYLVAGKRGQMDLAGIREMVAKQLPGYMVPDHIIEIEEVPITPNGKLDYRALPEPVSAMEHPVGDSGPPSLPESDSEKRLARLWDEILGCGPVGIDISFFDLGGHSLGGLKLFTRIHREFGVELPLATLFQAPTIRLLSQRIDGVAEKKGGPKILTMIASGEPAGTPLFLVHGGDGGTLFYRDFAERIKGAGKIYTIESPLLLDRSLVGPPESIEATASEYIRQVLELVPSGPVALGGYSFGGVVAYEMARQLDEAGKQVEWLYLFDTNNPVNEEQYWNDHVRWLREEWARLEGPDLLSKLAQEVSFVRSSSSRPLSFTPSWPASACE